MLSKKKKLASSKLYLVLDAQVNNYDELFKIAKESIRNGVDIIQLRDKYGSANRILEFSKKLRSEDKKDFIFIINDRVDLALAAQADGVHLGQEDLPLKFARKFLGNKKIIGLSCQTYKHAKDAERYGADYIGFGSVFKTLTKPERDSMDLDLLKRVVKNINIPVFAIGGINLNNVTKLSSISVNRVAVCRAISESKRVGETTKLFKKILINN